MRRLGSSADASCGSPARGSTSSPSDDAGSGGCPGTVDDTATGRFHDRAANAHYDEGSRARCYHDAPSPDSGHQYAGHAYDFHPCSARRRANSHSG